MTSCSENMVSQIKNLKAVLNSICDTKVKINMLNIRIAFYKDYEKIINSSSKQASNTTLTIHIQELELNNGRTIDQTADVLQEQKIL